MPTIPDLAQQKSEYPEAPPSTDINPTRFGRDAAALSSLGGEIGDFGNRLVLARKQAMESDVVANAKTEDTIAIDKHVDEIRKTWDPNNPESAAEGLRGKMNKMLETRLKQMPTGDAQRMYRDRMASTMESKYLETLKWENQSRAQVQLVNIADRTDKAAVNVYNSPTLDTAIEHIKDLDADIKSKAGVSIEVADAPGVYQKLGSHIAKSYFNGLADSSVEMSPERRMEALRMGRQLLKNPPKELESLLTGEDVRMLNGRFDAAEREGRRNDSYLASLEKKALQERRDKEQNKILDDIYNGKGSVKGILHSELDPDKKQTMLNILENRTKKAQAPNPKNLTNVISRIVAEDGTPGKINDPHELMDMLASNYLTEPQYRKALGYYQGKFTPEGQHENSQMKELIRSARSTLTKDAMGNPDPIGEQNVAQFMAFAEKQRDERKKAGKPTDDLFDQSKPGNLYQAIGGYRKSFQQSMQERMDSIKGQAPAPAIPEAPKGTVLMLDPNGKKFYVPEVNAEKARARGFKPMASMGRSPQSVSSPMDEYSTVEDAQIALEELDVERGNMDHISPAQEAEFNAREEALLNKIDELENAPVGNEDDLMKAARGSDAEELAIRSQLNAVQRNNRNASKK